MRIDPEDMREDDGETAPSETADKEASETIEKLTQAVEQQTKAAAEANEKYLRTYADFDNYRKRMQRDLADFRKYANEQLALELLSVVDHLGLALKHAAEAGEANDGLRQGVDMVYKQFRDILEKFGVKPFKAEGECFDPSKHDAVMQVTTAEAPENSVVQVFQEGYMYYDKVLRHAKVGVAKRPAGAPVGAEEKNAACDQKDS
ncbi:MAG TPA: nucleotide exchange factor GrpE [Nitrospirota bacterium]|nr:nucleotide exchange factor GrpE [Nitrospirota bacterium]